VTPLTELIDVLTRTRGLQPAIDVAGELIASCLRGGGKVLTCGNGGSAADACHLAQELLGNYERRRQPLPAVCLNADPTALTCIANDYGFDAVFSRQVTALARPGDVLIGFSTSGNSPNILAAFAAAKAAGAKTVLLGGRDGGQARGRCDLDLIVPSDRTARIQEVHTVIVHCWLDRVDAEFAPASGEKP